MRVQLTSADIRVAARLMRRRGFLIGGVIGLGIAAIGIVITELSGTGPGLVAMAAVYVAFLAYVVVARYRLSRPGALARRAATITVQDGGITVETERSRIERAWTTVRRAVLTDAHLLIQLRPLKVLCVPRRCFADSDRELRFVDIVAAHTPLKGTIDRDLTPIEDPAPDD